MKLTPKNKIIKGYKATDKNMQCLDFQFELGKWYKHDGDLEMCRRGFHFCEYPSGPWAFYGGDDTRIFKVEAKEVLLSVAPGSDLKHVAKQIRFIEEINEPDMNSGYRNTGRWNTGRWNTGSRNTGDMNTGYRNTGRWNTGRWNTGNRNTGDMNTGNGNTGHRNTGYMNTGNMNAGDGNCGNNHAGCLCFGDTPFYLFNKKADRSEVDFNLVLELSGLLQKDDNIDPEPFLSLPNATKKVIKKLHNAHKKVRKNN